MKTPSLVVAFILPWLTGCQNFPGTLPVATTSLPVAYSQSLTIVKGRPLWIHLAAVNPDDDFLSYSVKTKPTHGGLSGTAPTLLYQSNDSNFLGSDGFAFEVNNRKGGTARATVSIHIVPPDSGSYVYPLMPGTPAWLAADPEDIVAAMVIPQTWKDGATSWQLFCSAVGNPYFDTGCEAGFPLSQSYAAIRSGSVSLLSEVDRAPDFGINVLRFMEGLDMASVKADDFSDNNFNPLDYITLCYMAGLDSCINTLDKTSRQQLFRLAAWDAADLGGSSGSEFMAGSPVRLMYIIYNQPESFRGAFPPGVRLPALTSHQSDQLDRGSLPEELVPAVKAVKTALGLTVRP